MDVRIGIRPPEERALKTPRMVGENAAKYNAFVLVFGRRCMCFGASHSSHSNRVAVLPALSPPTLQP